MDEVPPCSSSMAEDSSVNLGQPSPLTLADFVPLHLLQASPKKISYHKHSSRAKNSKKTTTTQAVVNPMKMSLRCRKTLPSIPEEDLLKNVNVVTRESSNKTETPEVEIQVPAVSEFTANSPDMATPQVADGDLTGPAGWVDQFCYPPECGSEAVVEEDMEDAPPVDGNRQVNGERPAAGESTTKLLAVEEVQQVEPSQSDIEDRNQILAEVFLGDSEQISSLGEKQTALLESHLGPYSHQSPAGAHLILGGAKSNFSCSVIEAGNKMDLLDSEADQRTPHELQAGAIIKSKLDANSSEREQDQHGADVANMRNQLQHTPTSEFDTHFPPLTQGPTKRIGVNFDAARSVQNVEAAKSSLEVIRPIAPLQVTPKAKGSVNESGKGTEGNSLKNPTQQGSSSTDAKIGSTAAQVVKNGRGGSADEMGIKAPEPVTFDPEKIKKLGSVGEREGIPSICFSSSDTDYLTERLGYAIVGKFSHSIPSHYHIQKGLGNIKFTGSFSWKHINAKHFLIQFKELADYARMLNGPNGAPVWYVERHPMRVFKWTPEFDPFFESPIAAVWCNLIGLPIHLYEPSALFAIGGLLGKPIQADHATISQSRLSFARICVEIDISAPPTEEVVVDILGKEFRQKVIWDWIPLYCGDCRHVGHMREACYAYGKKTMPPKKDYASSGPSERWSSTSRSTHRIWRPRTSTAVVATSNTFASLERNEEPVTAKGACNGVASVTMAQSSNPRRETVDEDGFQQVRRRKDRHSQHTSLSRQSSGADDVTVMISVAGEGKEVGPQPAVVSSSGWGFLKNWGEDTHIQSAMEASKPRYYRQLPNGDFDTEELVEEVEMEEDEIGGQVAEHPPDPT